MTSNRKKLLVPDMMGRAGVDVLAARGDVELAFYPPSIAPAELQSLLGDAVGIALSVTPFGAAEVAAAPRLEVVARIGVGFDAVEVPALTARGVPLMVVGTANSTSVAEQAVFFMLALAKRALELDRMVRQGQWQQRLRALPMEIAGKTVLIVGFGRIGTRAALRCRALDLHVMVHDPYVSADAIAEAGYEPAADLDAALPRADFVSIHCPKNPETVGMFAASRLARMKPGAFLVNTARGGIVDEEALYDALVSGRLGGAGLDVFATEPADPGNPLLGLPSVILAPHMAGVTTQSVDAMSVAVARNMLDMLDGRPNPENVVNREILR